MDRQHRAALPFLYPYRCCIAFSLSVQQASGSPTRPSGLKERIANSGVESRGGPVSAGQCLHRVRAADHLNSATDAVALLKDGKDGEGDGLLLGPALLLCEVSDVGLDGCESGVSHLAIVVCGISPDVISMAYQVEGVNTHQSGSSETF